MGLQATFYMTASEYSQQQFFLTKNETAKNTYTSEEFELLKRRAKSSGVAFVSESTALELQYKLNYIDQYINKAIKGRTEEVETPNTSIKPQTGSTLDDIDGIPYDDNIDGIPLEEDIDGVSINGEIDGIPFDDDIDGIPMEDIDGVPFDD
jgi:hypothetical protein